MMLYDIINILLDLQHIYNKYKQYELDFMYICCDFNMKHPSFSLPSVSFYSGEDKQEYECLAQILIKYNIDIITHMENQHMFINMKIKKNIQF